MRDLKLALEGATDTPQAQAATAPGTLPPEPTSWNREQQRRVNELVARIAVMLGAGSGQQPASASSAAAHGDTAAASLRQSARRELAAAAGANAGSAGGNSSGGSGIDDGAVVGKEKRDLIASTLQEGVPILLVSNLDMLQPESRRNVVKIFEALLRECPVADDNTFEVEEPPMAATPVTSAAAASGAGAGVSGAATEDGSARTAASAPAPPNASPAQTLGRSRGRSRVRSRAHSRGRRGANATLLSSLLAHPPLLLDRLVGGFGSLRQSDSKLACGQILQLCVRRQVVARFMLRKDMQYVDELMARHVHDADFAVSTYAFEVFKALLTRHDGEQEDFGPAFTMMARRFDEFFDAYHSKLLQAENFATKRMAMELLESILTSKNKHEVVRRYATSLRFLRVVVELLTDRNKSVALNAFYILRLFVQFTKRVPHDIRTFFTTNHTQLLDVLSRHSVAQKDPDALQWLHGRLDTLAAMEAQEAQQAQETQEALEAQEAQESEHLQAQAQSQRHEA